MDKKYFDKKAILYKYKFIMQDYIENLNIKENVKKAIYYKYKEYMTNACKFFGNNSKEDQFNNNVYVFSNIFKSQVEALLKLDNSYEIYIDFIRENYTNIKPVSLNDEEIKVIKIVIDDKFDIFNYALSFNSLMLNDFIDKLHKIAGTLGYKDENSKLKPYEDDGTMPKDLFEAIRNVEVKK